MLYRGLSTLNLDYVLHVAKVDYNYHVLFVDGGYVYLADPIIRGSYIKVGNIKH